MHRKYILTGHIHTNQCVRNLLREWLRKCLWTEQCVCTGVNCRNPFWCELVRFYFFCILLSIDRWLQLECLVHTSNAKFTPTQHNALVSMGPGFDTTTSAFSQDTASVGTRRLFYWTASLGRRSSGRRSLLLEHPLGFHLANFQILWKANIARKLLSPARWSIWLHEICAMNARCFVIVCTKSEFTDQKCKAIDSTTLFVLCMWANTPTSYLLDMLADPLPISLFSESRYFVCSYLSQISYVNHWCLTKISMSPSMDRVTLCFLPVCPSLGAKSTTSLLPSHLGDAWNLWALLNICKLTIFKQILVLLLEYGSMNRNKNAYQHWTHEWYQTSVSVKRWGKGPQPGGVGGSKPRGWRGGVIQQILWTFHHAF